MSKEINRSSSELPSLREIEQEGAQAAERRAQSLLNDTLNKGGRLDLQGLERAGPQVRTAFVRLLAQEATRPLTNDVGCKATDKQHGPPRPGQRPGASRSPPTPALSVSPRQVGAGLQRRASMEWLDRRCEAPGFKAMAIYGGLTTALVALFVAFLITLLFQL